MLFMLRFLVAGPHNQKAGGRIPTMLVDLFQPCKPTFTHGRPRLNTRRSQLCLDCLNLLQHLKYILDMGRSLERYPST